MEQAAKVKAKRARTKASGSAEAGARLRVKGPGSLMSRDLFELHPEYVAPRLLGKLLVRWTSEGPIIGRIVEVEAYLGPHNNPPDPAAHTYRGPTPRNQVIFGAVGHAYVYTIYGRYFCMNVSCEPEGKAGCILLRALEPVGDFSIAQMARNRGLSPDVKIRQLASGPSRLCLALGLTRAVHNAVDLLDPASPLQLRDDGFRVTEAAVTARIGIKHAVDWPLRFLLPGHACASGPAKMAESSVGRCVFVS
jgi:DNA-3-methyladenine glycosylase